MESHPYLVFLGFIVACFATALSGAFFRPGQWYEDLAKPSWRPPNWLFGPVWAVLYAMIATSGWLVWRELGWLAGAVPLGLYAVQLLLNGLWSAIFFGMRRPGLACLEMIPLWLSILGLIVLFYPVHRGAALLLVPYLAWVSLAFVLNLSIWRLNSQSRAALT